MAARRNYGDGSIYQRASDGRYVGAFMAGWTDNGTRRRITVTAKTRAEAVRKLRDRRREHEQYGDSSFDQRMTVKTWAEQYLEMRANGIGCKPLRPNALAAARTPVTKWIIPAIGHRRLRDLNPGDVRKVIQAHYDAGKKTATADSTHRVLMTMLRYAKREGAAIPDNVFMVPGPGSGENDRRPLSLPETLLCLAAAQSLPHGLRWLFALLYGARQSEMLGMVEADPLTGEPLIDWEAGTVELRWQLQALPYVDTKDKSKGFRIPRGYKAVHLTLRWHLVEVKSSKGVRVLPLIPATKKALREWLDVRPANPWGLVFPAADGRPADHGDDREEWWAIQGLAGVGHPAGRYYHVHECRNSAATELDRVGASDTVAMSLMGHAQIDTTRRYQLADIDAKRQVIEAIAQRYELGSVVEPDALTE